MTLLWQPQEDQIAATNLARFQSFINERFDRDCRSFWDLHDFSIHDNERFWTGFWAFADIIGDLGGTTLLLVYAYVGFETIGVTAARS